MPLGSGAIAGTAYDIDVQFLAERLGFSRVAANSIDTSGDRDFVATFLYACAMTMVHLSRLAEDVILFSSEEFGFFEIDDSVATGSSLMPQKKNPDPLELVRGKSGKVVGLLTGWLTTMKGLPLGYNKDLQEDKAIAFEAEDTGRCAARVQRPPSCARCCCARASLGPPRPVCSSRPRWRITWSGAACRFALRTKSPAASSAISTRADGTFVADDGGVATLRRAFRRRHLGCDHARSGGRRARTPQSTNPEAVAAALAETKAWLRTSFTRRELHHEDVKR